ncbi:agmatinase family protein [Patulibacter sp. S7RM1-6]
MIALTEHLVAPGLVVNALKGDDSEHRAHRWLEWDGEGGLDAALLGAPFDGASVVRSGSRGGPDAVRSAMRGFTTYATSTGRLLSDLRVADVGDLDVVLTDMEGTFLRLRETIAALRSAGTVPITIGGDHSITWPLVEGVVAARPDERLGIIHIDQHHDLREAHFGAVSSGVPFRKALELPGRQVAGRNLVQLGIGEFANAPVHHDYARQHDVTVVTNVEIHERGLDACVGEAIARATDGTDAVYVSIDIDAIDQSQAPGTAAPNPNGLDARDVYRALRRIARETPVAGLDVVEISPDLEPGELTGGVGAMLVLSFLAGLQERRAAATA